MSESMELYYYLECPYCRIVLDAIDELGIADAIALKNIREDEQARQTLIALGGKQQVPCLFINGSPLYESRDIVEWLRSKFA